MRDLTLENPIRAIREICHDTTGRRTVRLANGRAAERAGHPARVPTTKAVDVRRPRGLERPAAQAGARPVGPHPDRRRDRRPRPGRHRDRLGHQVPPHRATTPPSTGSTSTTRGWPRSTSPTTTSTAAAGCSTCSSGAAWSPGSSATPRSSQAKVRPPQTTRAKLRGDFIRAAQEHRRDFTVDWVHLKLNDQAQRTVLCKDPFLAAGPAGRAAHRGHDGLTAARRAATCRRSPSR